MHAVTSKILLMLAVIATLLVVTPAPAANAATCPGWTVTKRLTVSMYTTTASGASTKRNWTLRVLKKGTKYAICFGNARQSGQAKIQWKPGTPGTSWETFWYTDNMAVVTSPPKYVRGIGKYRGSTRTTPWVNVRG